MDIKMPFKLSLQFLKVFRFKEWKNALYINIIIILLLIIFSESSSFNLFNYFIFIVYQYFLLSYSYLLNSYSDRKIDSEAGKNFLFNYQNKSILLLIVSLGFISFIIPFLFNNINIIILNIFIIFLATFYSLNPIRFKDKGVLGFLVSILTQRLLPLLVLLFIMPVNLVLFIYLSVWSVLLGLIYETSHQIEDYFNDKKTSIKTFVVQVGRENAKLILNFSSIFLLLYIFLPIVYSFYDGIFISILVFTFSIGDIFYHLKKFKL